MMVYSRIIMLFLLFCVFCLLVRMSLHKVISVLRKFGENYEEFFNQMSNAIVSAKEIFTMSCVKNHHRDTNRLVHSTRVSYLAYLIKKKLCKLALKVLELLSFLKIKLNLGTTSIIDSSMLHDFCEDDDYKNVLMRYIFHGFSSVRRVEKTFPGLLSWKEKNIIASHMFPAIFVPTLTVDAMIVSIADKIIAIIELDPFLCKKLNGSRKTISV